MSKTLRHLAVALATLLLGTVGSLVSASSAHAGLTDRWCESKTEGAYRLSFCVRGWVDPSGTHTRGVVEMHTYRYIAGGPNGGWVDSTSRSITLNYAVMQGDTIARYDWGNDSDANFDCRVNGPAGPIGCSVPNTGRVAFYSKDNLAPGSTYFEAIVYRVSFRDAEGVPHRFSSTTPLNWWGWGA